MTIYSNNIVRTYIENNFLPIPIPFQSKQPVIKGWQHLKITPKNIDQYFNGNAMNIGVLTGALSNGLVDIDIDDVEALRFAEWFLPETNCVFGRKSKPKSHLGLSSTRQQKPRTL
jgi:Bifunctional DNA primase/polymerase, N-terminal